MMLHRPCNFVYGTSEALRKDADSLDQITGEIIAAVVKRTGLPPSTIEGWFTGPDKYFDAQEAVKNHLGRGVHLCAAFDSSISRRGHQTGKDARGTTILADAAQIRDAAGWRQAEILWRA